MSSNPAPSIDPAFKDLCMDFKMDESHSPYSPISPTSTHFSGGAIRPLSNLLFSGEATDDSNISNANRLTNKYPNAWTDFYPSRAPCVYKSGPAWEASKADSEWGIIREACSVHCPNIAPIWVSVLQQIIECLDSLDVHFTCINPFGWANEGEEKPFCPFLLSVGITPSSLTYNDAVSTAVSIKEILAKFGLPEVEVAFVEMVVKSLAGGPKFLSLDPVVDNIPEYRKHFSSALGLPIASQARPYHEGTGALYLHLNSRAKDIALLTCAHVIHPPSIFPTNKSMTHTKRSQAKEGIIALGAGGYTRVITGMMAEIAQLTTDIEVWNRQLQRALPAARHRALTAEVAMATERIDHLNMLHSQVTKFRSTPDLRAIGWVLHSSPIQVSVQPLGYTEDWALIQLDPGMIDESFLGNKVFIGMSFPSFCSTPPFCSMGSFSVMVTFH